MRNDYWKKHTGSWFVITVFNETTQVLHSKGSLLELEQC